LDAIDFNVASSNTGQALTEQLSCETTAFIHHAVTYQSRLSVSGQLLRSVHLTPPLPLPLYFFQIKHLDVAFPQTYRHFSQRSLRLALELMGAELIQILMALNSIVETLDVIEDF
jgi:hypothetical protein